MTKHISVPFLVYHQSGLEDLAHTFEAGAQEAGGAAQLFALKRQCISGSLSGVLLAGYLRFIAEYGSWPLCAH